MSDNVIPIGGVTRLNSPSERVLEEAKAWVGDSVVIIAWDKDGMLKCVSSVADGGDMLWMLEKAKQMLLEVE